MSIIFLRHDLKQLTDFILELSKPFTRRKLFSLSY